MLSSEIFELKLIRALPIYWWVVFFIFVVTAAAAATAAAVDDDDDDDDDENEVFSGEGNCFRIADFIGIKLTFMITDATQNVGIFVICHNHTVAVTTTTITIISPTWVALEHVVI